MDKSAGVLYEDSIKKIATAVEQGLSFDQACSLIAVDDSVVRESIGNDSLKVIIAEMHISRGLPLKHLAMRLRLPLSRLLNAKKGMSGDGGEVAAATCPQGSQVA
jgi:hypothetical protein